MHPPACQAGPLGEANIDIDLPAGLLLDDRGESIRQAIVAPSDLLAILVGLTAAGLDVASGHHNYTFNNLLACFICADILQVCDTYIQQSAGQPNHSCGGLY